MAHRRFWLGVGGLIALLALLALAPVVGAAPARQSSGPSIDVDDQAIKDGAIVVQEVNAAQDGWIAVHLDEGGSPGKVIGHGPVKKGESYNVKVTLDQAVPTGGKIWPMLHIDAGTIGTYEFPGPDAPAKGADGNIVMKQITITGAEGQPAAGQSSGSGTASAANPSIDVDDQPIANGTITLSEVNAAQDGWIAVHLDEGGSAGRVIGHGPVKKGESYNVKIKLDQDVPVGGKVWPMLHIDAGAIGTYEFPGPDAPVIVNGDIVMKQITITAAKPGGTTSTPSRLPTTGGEDTGMGLLALALALLLGGGVLRRSRRA